MSLSLDLTSLWTPLPTQQKFLDAFANAPDLGGVAYVGAYGSGKTWVLCRAALGLALSDPGSRILIGRLYGTDLRDTTQTQFFELVDEVEQAVRKMYTAVDAKSLIGEFAVTRNEYQFSNGSLILFRPLDQAEEKYKSLNASVFLIDEGSEVPLPSVMLLKSRIRGKKGRRVWGTVSNPTSTRHWLYEWFVANPKTGRPLPDHVLFRTDTSENSANLPAGYIDSLKAAYPEDWVRVYLLGEWGELRTGQRPVFPTFAVRDHVGPTQWDQSRPIFVGIDWGYKAPGVVWFQVNDKNQVLIHRCWFPKEIRTQALGEGILLRNGEWFPGDATFYYFGGWDGTKKHASAEKPDIEIFRGMKIPVTKVYSQIDRGLSIMRQLLEKRDDGSFGIVVNPVNERMIEGWLGGYHYAPKAGVVLSVEDVSVVKEVPAEDGTYDQLFDAFRYALVKVFDVPTASPVSHIRYGYRKGTRKRERIFSTIPSRRSRVIGFEG